MSIFVDHVALMKKKKSKLMAPKSKKIHLIKRGDIKERRYPYLK